MLSIPDIFGIPAVHNKDTMDYINTNIITKSLKSLLTSNRKISPAVPSTESNMSVKKHTDTSEKIVATPQYEKKISHAPPRPSHQQKVAMSSAPVSVETRSTEEQSKVPHSRPQKPSARQLRRMKRRLFLEAVNSTNQPINRNKLSPRNSMRISKRRSTGRE